MKRIILLIFLLQSIITQAQSEGITYQAVIYNPAGEQLPGVNNPYAPLLNQSVCLRFNLISSNGLLEYQEFIQTTTDSFGMVNLLIGRNTPTGEGAVNDFSEIQWVTDSKSLIVELDTSGDCQNFEEISNQPLNYVPFAYYAKNSDADAAVATLQADVDQNEADADTAIAANTTSIATTQADVDANETTAANATAAVQADVDQNEADADAADAAATTARGVIQADVDAIKATAATETDAL